MEKLKDLINTYTELEVLLRTIEDYSHSTQDNHYYNSVVYLHKAIVNFNKYIINYESEV